MLVCSLKIVFSSPSCWITARRMNTSGAFSALLHGVGSWLSSACNSEEQVGIAEWLSCLGEDVYRRFCPSVKLWMEITVPLSCKSLGRTTLTLGFPYAMWLRVALEIPASSAKAAGMHSVCYSISLHQCRCRNSHSFLVASLKAQEFKIGGGTQRSHPVQPPRLWKDQTGSVPPWLVLKAIS